MKPSNKLSIIIVSWNARDYLIKCLESLAQGLLGVPAEVIVVDNFSSDGSADAVEKFSPKVNLVRNDQNYGFAKANNMGIKLSSGEYLCLLNSDVIVGKNCFSQLLTCMDSNPNIGMLGPRTLNADGTLQRSCFTLPTVWNSFCRVFALDAAFPNIKMFGTRLMTYFPHNEMRAVEALNGCFLLIRRKALNEVGLLDEGFFIYGEDLDWCKRFGDSGWEVVYYPLVEAVHYGGASSSNAPIRFFLEMQRADLRYWRKHKGLKGEMLYYLMLLLHHTLRILGYAPLSIIRHRLRTVRSYKLRRSVESLRWLVTRYLFEKRSKMNEEEACHLTS